MNTYTYVGENPILYSDPTGEAVQALAAPVAAVAVFGARTIPIGYRVWRFYQMAQTVEETAADAASSSSEKKQCEDDNDCKDPLSDWEWKRLVEKYGMEGHPHNIKEDIIGGSVRLFDLCKCKDGSVVVRRKGCVGEPQPTGYNTNI
jgi:hypothetical protein